MSYEPHHVGEPRQPNRLSKETSPYLRQHQFNPVDWHPWGAEAFEKAKREDKPLPHFKSAIAPVTGAT